MIDKIVTMQDYIRMIAKKLIVTTQDFIRMLINYRTSINIYGAWYTVYIIMCKNYSFLYFIVHVI